MGAHWRKHFVSFLVICSLQRSQGQHLDEASLNELHLRGSNKTRFPHCMLDNRTMELWCDKSRYETISEITIGDASNGYIASNIKVLWINDSRLLQLNAGDLAMFDSLTMFVAEDNFLTTLRVGIFVDNPLLEVIDLTKNKIRSIEKDTFRGLTHLELLEMGWNRIAAISWQMFGGLNNLKHLLLERNQIQIVPKRAFISCKKLKTLILNGNKISQMHKYAFHELSELEHLDLSNNMIQEIVPKTFYPLKRLRTLILRGNQISTYPYDLRIYTKSLEVLDIGSNHLRDFGNQTFAILKQLRTLKIDHNSLIRIGETLFHENTKLELLNISVNVLEDISANAFATNRNLSTLLLQSNHLRTPRLKWFAHLGSLPTGEGNVNLSDNNWWCDCTTKEFENYMVKARDENPNFSKQLDIQCSSNMEYVGKLSELDIFCPADNSYPPTTSKPGKQTTLQTPTSASIMPSLIGMLRDEPVITDANKYVATEKSTSTSQKTPSKTSTVQIVKSSTSKTLQEPSVLLSYNPQQVLESTGNNSIVIGGVMVISIIGLIIVGLAFVCKRSKSHGLRKIWVSSRRKRHLSSQPILEGNKVELYDRELSEPFSVSDDEEVQFSQSPYQAQDKPKLNDTFLAVEEETFYTPRTTPRQTPKMASHRDRDDA